jgi:hypothetical protein
MGADQEWCLQCGAGAPGSLGASTPSWRSTTAILGATAILALGAAAAAYAALSKGSPSAHVVTATVAQVAPPVATTPTTTPLSPGAAGTAAGAGAAKTALPRGLVKPPKIPLKALVPKTPNIPKATAPSSTSTPAIPTPASPVTGGSTNSQEPRQTAMLLDTNAATTYNPYNYPATNFGDPSLTIDGDATTGWTAQVLPSTAPRMAEGLLIDLKSAQKLAALTLKTPSTGMTVQVYGANAHTVPASITDPAWVPLSAPLDVRKKKMRIALRHAGKGFSNVALWISKAPASAIGTEQAPGHVSINEVELFRAS